MANPLLKIRFSLLGTERVFDIIGKCYIGITDGDTLTLLTLENRQIKVRLAEIDTPEKRQLYGNRSKQVLSNLAFGKQARIEVQTIDRYGRSVAHVYINGVDIGRKMVRKGSAWVYREYMEDETLLAVETAARADQRGLWSLHEAQRVPPWQWRHTKRARTHKAATECGPKYYCGDMTTCAEARRYLSCGLTRLDGDGDGVPCEALCQ